VGAGEVAGRAVARRGGSAGSEMYTDVTNFIFVTSQAIFVTSRVNFVTKKVKKNIVTSRFARSPAAEGRRI
jgi:hypothetical protein